MTQFIWILRVANDYRSQHLTTAYGLQRHVLESNSFEEGNLICGRTFGCTIRGELELLGRARAVFPKI